LRYLDISIPLCIQTEQPAEKVGDCVEIMERVRGGKERVMTNAFTLAEMFHILAGRERVSPSKIMEIFSAFLDCRGLKIVDARWDLCQDAVALALERKVDFIDAHHVLTMRKFGINEIYSLDPHFDRFPGVRRFVKLGCEA